MGQIINKYNQVRQCQCDTEYSTHLCQNAFLNLFSNEVDVTVGSLRRFAVAASRLGTHRLVGGFLFRSQVFPLAVPVPQIAVKLFNKARRRSPRVAVQRTSVLARLFLFYIHITYTMMCNGSPHLTAIVSKPNRSLYLSVP